MNIFNNIIVTDISAPIVVHSEKGRHFRMENRPNFGISFCISGEITYSMNGKKYISQPDTAIILPQGGTYSLYGDKEGLFPVVNFKCENCNIHEIIVLKLTDARECLKEFDTLKNLFFESEKHLKIYSSFYSLLSLVSSGDSDARNPLANIIQYIAERISNPELSNSELAKTLGISEVYLRKLFVSHYNITPKQYILNSRIQRAKQLLSDTHHTITAISEECGFGSLYHFCRAFKEKTGFTPTEYAKLHKVYQI